MKSFFIYLASGLIFMITGCGAMIPKQGRLLLSARYGELERYMEDKVRDPAKAPNIGIHDLCLSYSGVKHYDKLFPCLDEIQKRVDRGDTQLKVSGILAGDLTPYAYIWRMQAWIELGDYSRAIDYGNKAYPVVENMKIRQQRAYFIDLLSVLGLAHALNGEKKEASRYLRELEKINTAYPHTTLRTPKLKGIAKIYMATGSYDKALSALKKDDSGAFKALASVAVAAVVQVGDMWSFEELPKEYMLNKLSLETGDVARAKTGFDILLGIPQISENGEIYWMALLDRGRIAELEGDNQLAIELYERAINVIEEQRSTINTEVNKIGFVGNKQEAYNQIVSLLFSQGQYSEAFEYVERARARALVDMLASRNQFAKTGVGSHQATDLIAKLNMAEAETKVRDETITTGQFRQQRAVVVEIKEKIRNTDPELASLVAVTSPDIAEIQRMLPADETLVEYFGSDDTLFAFILNDNEVRGVKLELAGLKSKVELFRDYMLAPNSNEFKTGGQFLFKELIKPIEAMIFDQNLTIVPHGVLHYLPFNAIYDKENFLIDRYNIRVLPSASVMKFIKERREGHAGNLLAFGNPDIGDSTYDLPGAQNEAIIITKNRSKSTVLLRGKATETALKQYGAEFRYLHFATHGIFDAEKPLSSKLLLASDSKNDGELTVGELYALHLPADLVTLSACETGLGKVANGDDVVGFTRGFLYAGTSTIVSSLWKVDDQATAILMQQFYKHLKEKDKRSALRAAQLEIKNNYNSHPYFWAAFQLTGSVQ